MNGHEERDPEDAAADGGEADRGRDHHDDKNDHDQGHDHDHDHAHDHDHDHAHDHDHHSHDVSELGFALLTVSSSRSLVDDAAGEAVAELVEADDHTVVDRDLVPDSYDDIQQVVQGFVERDDVDCVVTTGGTGVTPDDVTVEAVEGMFDKQLPGFGELFRTLSYEEIGTKVVATRATAGVVDGAAVFCLPGSENAVRLGTEEIVLPEAPHLVGLAGRDG